MDQSDLLRVLSLCLPLVLIVAMRRWPGLNYRKFDWRLFKSKERKQKTGRAKK